METFLQTIENSIWEVDDDIIRKQLVKEIIRIDDILYDMSANNELYHQDEKLDRRYEIENNYKDKIHAILEKLK